MRRVFFVVFDICCLGKHVLCSNSNWYLRASSLPFMLIMARRARPTERRAEDQDGTWPSKSIHTRAYAPCAPCELLGLPSRDRPCHHALSQLTHIDNLVYHVVLSFVFFLIPFPACIAGGGLTHFFLIVVLIPSPSCIT